VGKLFLEVSHCTSLVRITNYVFFFLQLCILNQVYIEGAMEMSSRISVASRSSGEGCSGIIGSREHLRGSEEHQDGKIMLLLSPKLSEHITKYHIADQGHSFYDGNYFLFVN
jgi:hypothetical protein